MYSQWAPDIGHAGIILCRYRLCRSSHVNGHPRNDDVTSRPEHAVITILVWGAAGCEGHSSPNVAFRLNAPGIRTLRETTADANRVLQYVRAGEKTIGRIEIEQTAKQLKCH